MNTVTTSNIIIDKISLTVEIPETLQKICINNFENNLSDWGYRCSSPRYYYSWIIKDNKGFQLKYELSPSRPNVRFCRLEYNPANYDQNHLYYFLQNNLPGGMEYVINNSIITRIDLAIDIHGVNISDLLFRKPGVYKTKCYFEDLKITKNELKSSKIETIEYGSRNSNIYYTFYNKVSSIKKNNLKKQKEHKIPIPDYPVTRIEAKLKNTKITFKDIINIKNPFKKLEVYQINSSKLNNSLAKMALRLSQYETFQQVTSALSKQERRELIDLFSKVYAADFWKPDEIWEALIAGKFEMAA